MLGFNVVLFTKIQMFLGACLIWCSIKSMPSGKSMCALLFALGRRCYGLSISMVLFYAYLMASIKSSHNLYIITYYISSSFNSTIDESVLPVYVLLTYYWVTRWKSVKNILYLRTCTAFHGEFYQFIISPSDLLFSLSSSGNVEFGFYK